MIVFSPTFYLVDHNAIAVGENFVVTRQELTVQRVFVSGQIPECGRSETSVRLLDPGQFIHFLHDVLDVILNLLDGAAVHASPLNRERHLHASPLNR